MSKPAQVLQIEPAHDIVFKGPFTDVITTYLDLTNPSDRQVCFKVKTTAPKQYCVRPNSGIIPSKGSAKVAVMLQPFDYNGEEKSKHKFMVQTAYVPENETSLDNIWKAVGAGELMDSKLRVVFEMPASSGEHGHGDDALKPTHITPPKQSSPSTEAELRRVVDEKKRLQADYNALERECLQLRERAQRAENSPSDAMAAPASVNMLHVFIVAIVALVLGLLVGKIF